MHLDEDQASIWFGVQPPVAREKTVTDTRGSDACLP